MSDSRIVLVLENTTKIEDENEDQEVAKNKKFVSIRAIRVLV